MTLKAGKLGGNRGRFGGSDSDPTLAHPAPDLIGVDAMIQGDLGYRGSWRLTGSYHLQFEFFTVIPP